MTGQILIPATGNKSKIAASDFDPLNGPPKIPMARADLLLNLIRSGARGDQAQFEKTVEALAAEERAKNHGILADRLLAS